MEDLQPLRSGRTWSSCVWITGEFKQAIDLFTFAEIFRNVQRQPIEKGATTLRGAAAPHTTTRDRQAALVPSIIPDGQGKRKPRSGEKE